MQKQNITKYTNRTTMTTVDRNNKCERANLFSGFFFSFHSFFMLIGGWIFYISLFLFCSVFFFLVMVIVMSLISILLIPKFYSDFVNLYYRIFFFACYYKNSFRSGKRWDIKWLLALRAKKCVSFHSAEKKKTIRNCLLVKIQMDSFFFLICTELFIELFFYLCKYITTKTRFYLRLKIIIICLNEFCAVDEQIYIGISISNAWTGESS